MASKLARLELNFAPVRRNAPLGWLLLATGLVVATIAGVQFRFAHAERLMHAGAASAIGANRLALSSDASAAPADPRAARAATVVARDLRVPWSEMLTALEAVQARDVALLGVEPSPARHDIRITAEAKTPEAMLNYVEALRSETFPQVNLASHQVQTQTPGSPVRFVVQARWKSP